MEKRIGVLLIEDDPFQREIIREYLEAVTRYKILEAQGQCHILACCENPLYKVGIVLVDMDWPRAGRVDLVLEIRRRNPTLPILGMTDHSVHPSKDPRLWMSFIEFIPKPFAPHHLNRSVQAVLNAREVSGIGMKPKRKKAIQENGV